MAITNVLVTDGDAANVFISPTNTAITAMYFCNVDSVARDFDLYLLPAGNTITQTSNKIYSNITLQAGDTYVIDTEKLILSVGDVIRANTTATDAMSCTISFIGL